MVSTHTRSYAAATFAVVAAVLALFASLGCGGTEDPGGSAASSGATGGSAGGLVIPPPDPPKFVDWECANGWLPEKVLDGTPEEHSICIPPPLPETCPDGMMPVVGDVECRLIGDPCPAGDWPEGLPAEGAILYVQAGAVGGDGSKSVPFGSIAAAVKAASAGAVIAVAKGTYAEAVTITKKLTLWGACVTGTTLVGPAGGPTAASILVQKPGRATIRNVTITGPRIGILLRTGATVEGRSIRIVGASSIGIAALGGTLDLEGVAVMDTNATPEGLFGRGLDVEEGASATVLRSAFQRNRDIGIYAAGPGTKLTITEVAVSDTRSQESDERGGRGLGLQAGAHATVRRAVLERNREVGIAAASSGTELMLIDIVVRDTQSQTSDAGGGIGLGVQVGAHATVLRAVLERNRNIGVHALDSGTELGVTDIVIRNTEGRESDEGGGFGLTVQEGARATVQRAVLERNRDVGVYVWGLGTELMLTDGVVRDTQTRKGDHRSGRGLNVQEGAQLNVERGIVRGNSEMGVVAVGPGMVLGMTHVVVDETQPRETNGEYGVGVVLLGNAAAEVSSSRITGNRVAGILLMGGSTLSMSSSEILATQAGSVTLVGPDGDIFDGPHHDDLADGLLVTGNSSATVSNVRVAGCLRAGVLFSNSTGKLDSVTSTDNRFGLVLQGDPQPSDGDLLMCSFDGNGAEAIVHDGDLPVPDAPIDLPEDP